MKTCHRPTSRTHQLSGFGVINCVLRVTPSHGVPCGTEREARGAGVKTDGDTQIDEALADPRGLRVLDAAARAI